MTLFCTTHFVAGYRNLCDGPVRHAPTGIESLSPSSNNNDNNIGYSIDLNRLDDKHTAPVQRLDNPAVTVKYDRDLNDWCVCDGRVTAMEYLFYGLSLAFL
jgi:hypothetical protein